MKRLLVSIGVALCLAILGFSALGRGPLSPEAVLARANDAVDCPVSHQTLKGQLIVADAADTTGLNNHYWAVVVNRGGVVCAVAFSGPSTDSQWLLSRQIAAAKAFTANGLSLDGAPLSSAQLYPWVQPGAPANPLFGLAAGNPVSPEAAYQGLAEHFGTKNDPMVGKRVGGTITFGGGLALYDGQTAIGGLGLSGDTACADHSTAWRLRNLLGMAPASGNDKITLDNTSGHPHCPNDGATQGKN
jgi:uncharacterized protein GlcG (DUF336 family)